MHVCACVCVCIVCVCVYVCTCGGDYEIHAHSTACVSGTSTQYTVDQPVWTSEMKDAHGTLLITSKDVN